MTFFQSKRSYNIDFTTGLGPHRVRWNVVPQQFTSPWGDVPTVIPEGYEQTPEGWRCLDGFIGALVLGRWIWGETFDSKTLLKRRTNAHQWFLWYFLQTSKQFQCMKRGGKNLHFCRAKTVQYSDVMCIDEWMHVNMCIYVNLLLRRMPDQASKLPRGQFNSAIECLLVTLHQKWSFALSFGTNIAHDHSMTTKKGFGDVGRPFAQVVECKAIQFVARSRVWLRSERRWERMRTITTLANQDCTFHFEMSLVQLFLDQSSCHCKKTVASWEALKNSPRIIVSNTGWN